MTIDIVTIFPGMFDALLTHGLMRRALADGLLEVRCHDLRDWTEDRHRTVDDRPFGGGEGMVLKPEPLARAIRALSAVPPTPRVVYLTPQGARLEQAGVRRLAGHPRLLLLCGRYEGIDQRIVDRFVHEEISIGDYVLSGGELPAMVLVEAISRCLPGVVGHPDSVTNESFSAGLLDCPAYTRPEDFEGQRVPEVLLSGDHQKIREWRRQAARERTLDRRPDLLGPGNEHHHRRGADS